MTRKRKVIIGAIIVIGLILITSAGFYVWTVQRIFSPLRNNSAIPTKETYQNPFKNPGYENPFSDYKNPFEDIK